MREDIMTSIEYRLTTFGEPRPTDVGNNDADNFDIHPFRMPAGWMNRGVGGPSKRNRPKRVPSAGAGERLPHEGASSPRQRSLGRRGRRGAGASGSSTDPQHRRRRVPTQCHHRVLLCRRLRRAWRGQAGRGEFGPSGEQEAAQKGVRVRAEARHEAEKVRLQEVCPPGLRRADMEG